MQGTLHAHCLAGVFNSEDVIFLNSSRLEITIEATKHCSVVLEHRLLCVNNSHVVLDIQCFDRLRPGKNILLVIFQLHLVECTITSVLENVHIRKSRTRQF
jgi:hypothetical protein